MGCLKFILFIAVPIAIAISAYFFLHEEAVFPKLVDGWWGKGSPGSIPESVDVKPFKISISNNTMVDLRQRLQMQRFPNSIEGTNFEYGFHSTYMKEVVKYWLEKYSWPMQEKLLNSFDQFKTRIEGIDVHFVRVKPAKFSGVVRPLLMVHGWPGSFFEFYKIIPLLTKPLKDENGKEALAFEVICPSIPGYGFSEQPHQPGFDGSDAARIFYKLMNRLGHTHFYVQGGDWGAMITSIMAKAYPSNVLGLHTNMPLVPVHSICALAKQLIGAVLPSLIYTPIEIANQVPLLEIYKFMLIESGYMHIQATKPDTVAFSLNDSPVGLAAYILEKFSTWTHRDNHQCPDGCLTKYYTLDELLTNVMIYWTTDTIGSSMRFYKDNFPKFKQFTSTPITVPSAIALFPQELPGFFKSVAGIGFPNLVQYTDMPRGGHFAAFQEPQLLADDIRSFVTKVESDPTGKKSS